VKSGTFGHAPTAKDGRNLDNGVLVIVGLEKGELLCEKAQQNNPARPDVDD
jgi:hypothetical protein